MRAMSGSLEISDVSRRVLGRHDVIDPANVDEGGPLRAQGCLERRQQFIAAEGACRLQRHRTLHLRVDHVGQIQSVSQNRANDRRDVGIDEVELVTVPCGAPRGRRFAECRLRH